MHASSLQFRRTAWLSSALLISAGALKGSAQGLPDEIMSRMSSIPTFSDQTPTPATGGRSPAGSNFRPSGTTGRALTRKDFFGEQLRASRGYSGENQAALAATAARAAAARQQLRTQQQRQLLSLRQAQSQSNFRDARHMVHHTLTIGAMSDAAPPAPPVPGNVSVRLPQAETRLAAVAQRLPIADLAIHIKDRTAILTGKAANEHTARLASRIVALEPGVSQVDNRLIIASK